MKSYILLYFDSITYKYRVYKYLCNMLYYYIRVLYHVSKLSSKKGFRPVLEGILGITNVSEEKTDINVL